MNNTETIAAIATSLSESGISIIRVSGEDACLIGERIFRSNNGKNVKDFNTHSIHYGFIYDGDELVDEVMMSIMRAPHTYTTEDTIEINCHGGVLITKKILSTVLKNGARLALPGEFTKRAFLGGRIDLTKAEAIMDIISANNDMALKASIKQLKGNVHEKISELRNILIHETAFIESALDDPEHISLDGYSTEIRDKVKYVSDELNSLLKSFDNGRIVKDGVLTVIVGKPNAGKSSFLNMIIGEEKAIVTNIAGTTRDALEENIKINDIALKLVDTAGIRFTKDEVEKIGVEKAKNYINDADLVLYVVDSSKGLDDNDEEIIKLIADKKIIVLYNKTDLESKISIEEVENLLENNKVNKDNYELLKISAKNLIGYEEFSSLVKDFIFNKDISSNEELMITNLRHKENIENAIESLKLLMNSIDDCMPEDFFTIDLMSAYASLGNIIGEDVSEDLVNEIFGKFCMGK